MINLFRNRKIRKQLASIGSQVSEEYIVVVNNLDAMSFPTKSDAFNYIKRFRDENIIFNLSIHRVNIYSL